MKIIFLFSLFALCPSGLAQDVPFQRFGRPFVQTNLDLIWGVLSNDLPSALSVFRVVSPTVSPAVASNLIALGSFSAKDRETVPGYPEIMSYTAAGGKRSFRIIPSWAEIYYSDQDADDMHITAGVPNAEQAFEIATNWLSKLGIDRNELTKKPDQSGLQFHVGDSRAVLYKSADGPPYTTNLHAREVTFMRSLGGVQVFGGSARGGCSILIGHHGKIANIEASWRSYHPDPPQPVAKPQTFLKWIREGKAVWRFRQDQWPSPDWPSAKKLVITKVTPYYFSEGYSEYDTPLNWAAPFAELEARVETAQTNSMIYLDCPIIEPDTTHVPK